MIAALKKKRKTNCMEIVGDYIDIKANNTKHLQHISSG
jgi:hypothetical protein